MRVIICVQVALLPQASVTLYVLVVVSVQFTVFTWSPTCVTTNGAEPPPTVTNAVLGAGTVALHPNGRAGGHVIVGGPTIVTCCVQVTWSSDALFNTNK